MRITEKAADAGSLQAESMHVTRGTRTTSDTVKRSVFAGGGGRTGAAHRSSRPVKTARCYGGGGGTLRFVRARRTHPRAPPGSLNVSCGCRVTTTRPRRFVVVANMPPGGGAGPGGCRVLRGHFSACSIGCAADTALKIMFIL